jgi:hypothetical protein
MHAITQKQTLPFELGEPRSFGALTLIPLYPAKRPRLEYLGLVDRARCPFVTTRRRKTNAHTA